MARRNRYREFEKKTTLIILADVAVFLLYLLFAGLGVIAMKVITAIIHIRKYMAMKICNFRHTHGVSFSASCSSTGMGCSAACSSTLRL